MVSGYNEVITMSFIPTMEYILGLGFFSFIYWIMDGIFNDIVATDIGEQSTQIFQLLEFLWMGALIIYLVFGSWWLIRKYNEKEYYGGF